MGILSDWFDVDPDTEDTIKDVVKAVGLIALLPKRKTSASGDIQRLCLRIGVRYWQKSDAETRSL